MPVLSSVIAVLAFFIMPADTTLSDKDLNAVVDLPAGYFVMRAEGAAPEGYMPVVYDDLTGYVKLSDVTAVDYTPVTKYETTATFFCDNDGQPVNLRAAPRRSADVIKVLGATASGRVYGTIKGDALIKNGDTLWYYVCAEGVRGYCYYAHVSASAFPPNIIEKEPPEVPDVPASADEAQSDDAAKSPAPSVAMIILIVALCVPVPFVMFYLFKKPKDRDQT